MVRSVQHEMLAVPSHDEAARQRFVVAFKQHLNRALRPRNRVAFEQEVAPAFEKRHGRAPAGRREIRDGMLRYAPARVVHAEASGILARDYVTAARLIGASGPSILRGHVLPAIAPTIFVIASFHFGEMLIAESALSFPGIGAPVGAATYGLGMRLRIPVRRESL